MISNILATDYAPYSVQFTARGYCSILWGKISQLKKKIGEDNDRNYERTAAVDGR